MNGSARLVAVARALAARSITVATTALAARIARFRMDTCYQSRHGVTRPRDGRGVLLAERGRFAATITDSYRSRVNLAHLLCLGDSYTIGESVMPEARWPVLLAARLRVSGLDVADPDLVARTGWTTDELEEGIESA